MKKLILFAALVFCGLATAHADGREEPIPFERLPQTAQTFHRQFIRKIGRDPYTWEIELSGGMEIKFDRKFTVIGYND